MAIVRNGNRSSPPESGGRSESPSFSTSASGGGGGADADDSSAESDSGLASDEVDVSEMVEAGFEFCQVENESCSLPLDLYDLPDLKQILSIETWNECLTEEERMGLAARLPDMDEENFGRTLTELFSGVNFHFGSPVEAMFKQLKAGVCDPRVVLYRRGKKFLNRREHYNYLREYHDSMVGRLVWIRDAWRNCEGYGTDERVRLLRVLKERERDGGFGSDEESEDMGERFPNKRVKMGRTLPQGLHQVAKMKYPATVKQGQLARQGPGFDSGGGRRVPKRDYDDSEDQDYETSNEEDWKTSRGAVAKAGSLNHGKKQAMMDVQVRYADEEDLEGYPKSSYSVKGQKIQDSHARKKAKNFYRDAAYTAKKDYVQVEDLAGSHSLQQGNVKVYKGKMGSNSKAKSYNDISAQNGHSNIHYDPSGNEKIRGKSGKSKGTAMGHSRNSPMFAPSDETDSASSDQNEDTGYPTDTEEGQQLDSRKINKPLPMNKKVRSHLVDAGPTVQTPPPEAYNYKANQKGKTNYATERNRKEIVDLQPSLLQSTYVPDYDNDIPDENEDDLSFSSKFANTQMKSGKSTNKFRTLNYNEVMSSRAKRPLVGCNTGISKWKGRSEGTYYDDPDEAFPSQSSLAKHSDDPVPLKKKSKKKADAAGGSAIARKSEQVELIKEKSEIEVEKKPEKKPVILITPSVHTGFSFSLIHFLSAVRKAMVTPHMEGTIGIGPLVTAETNKAPPLTVQEIVNLVRSNPGDPCILDTQVPLQDLVRGMLRIFASKTAPLGAKGWKALVLFEKSKKVWTWVGPVLASSPDNETFEEETSPERWGIPHAMLVKLVDAFANWLKSSQDTLQQIGSLPAPPIEMLPNLEEKERFKDLRAQKSLNTFKPTTDEMRAYYRREEHLRYSIPDRAFSYTAYDGKKSIVAPLRRGGGKPTSKPRDHFMLKIERPPHVTILCLVRDAAARLPGSIGTRADVSTLIRDSQYIVEDISDEKVNQIVSGALDRLHYEQDPCVKYDSDRKLWVYQHRDREEEDFDDDGTSSTKKWKRGRKDATDGTDTGPVNDTRDHTRGDPSTVDSSARYHMNPDLNTDSTYVQTEEQPELIFNGLMSNVENIQSYIVPTQVDRRQGTPVSWDVFGLNPLRENTMMCQQNSTNQDFDDGTFSRGRQVGS